MNKRLSLILETVENILEQEKRKLLVGADARARVSKNDPSVVALPPEKLEALKNAQRAAAELRAQQKAAKRGVIKADSPPTTKSEPTVGALFGKRFSREGERLPVAVGQINDTGVNPARLSGKTIEAMMGPAGGVRHESPEEIAARNLRPNTKLTGQAAVEATKRARISPTAEPRSSAPVHRALPGGSDVPEFNLAALMTGRLDEPRTRGGEGGPKPKRRKKK